MERLFGRRLIFFALLLLAGLYSLMKKEMSAPAIPNSDAVVMTYPGAMAMYGKLLMEYQELGKLAKEKIGTPDNEVATLNKHFASMYLAEAYARLSKVEKGLVGMDHKEPDFFSEEAMGHFKILDDLTKDVWESKYRESLKKRGFRLP